MRQIIFFSMMTALLATSCQQENSAGQTDTGRKSNSSPNFIFIFADDLGYGDLSCYGSSLIRTPNLDMMADSGAKFTDLYSASPVCSPSRAALLTGRYAARQGIYSVFFPESWTGIDTSSTTMAELLKRNGYKTGCVGKWHLGHHFPYLPLQNGFDEYFGMPYSNDMAGRVYMRGNAVVEQQPDQHFLTQTYTQEAVSFIERNAKTPFFLYLAHNMPHVPLYASPNFEGRSGNGIYADVVEELDASVGEIIKKVKELKLEKNTVIIFSSDNGPWLAMGKMSGSAGGLREGKQFTFDGGMKVPGLVYAPGLVKAGKVVTSPASMMDWMPTFAGLAGIKINDSLEFDGIDISAQLCNDAPSPDRSLIYFANEKAEAFRQGNMKIKLPYKGNEASWWKTAVPAHDTLLFDLKNDPGEKINLWPTAPSAVKSSILSDFKNSLKKLGPLPASLVTKYDADISHTQSLKDK